MSQGLDGREQTLDEAHYSRSGPCGGLKELFRVVTNIARCLQLAHSLTGLRVSPILNRRRG